MIEINRKLYMDEVTKEKLDLSGEFRRVQDDLKELLGGVGWCF